MEERIHFVGLGGIGISALAQVAQARGHRVSGSDTSADPKSNPALARLIATGATYYRGHRRENIAEGVTLLVATAAVGDENQEIAEARDRGIRVVSRAAYLGELMDAHRGPKVAVAGTHGKTTTTGMIGVMLQDARLDPTVFVGAEVAQLGGNVRIGSPEGPIVVEACEAYDSFLHLRPDIAVVTNVEADHLDHYGTEAGVVAAFRRFLCGVAAGGSLVACSDDAGVRRLLDIHAGEPLRRTLTYGTSGSDLAVAARSLELGPRPAFELTGPWAAGETTVRLRVPGRHNVENALAAAATGFLLGLTFDQIRSGLEAFQGAERRQDVLGEVAVEGGEAIVIDDYAHHPTEIRATVSAIRSAFPGRRLVTIFQPHLYSRTRDFLQEFAEALAEADVLVVTDIYPAREEPILGVSSEDILTRARAARPRLDGRYIADRQQIPAQLAVIVRSGDLVVFMGAGDIREEAEAFIARAGGASR